jgi:hypothetical protein
VTANYPLECSGVYTALYGSLKNKYYNYSKKEIDQTIRDYLNNIL